MDQIHFFINISPIQSLSTILTKIGNEIPYLSLGRFVLFTCFLFNTGDILLGGWGSGGHRFLGSAEIIIAFDESGLDSLFELVIISEWLIVEL